MVDTEHLQHVPATAPDSDPTLTVHRDKMWHVNPPWNEVNLQIQPVCVRPGPVREVDVLAGGYNHLTSADFQLCSPGSKQLNGLIHGVIKPNVIGRNAVGIWQCRVDKQSSSQASNTTIPSISADFQSGISLSSDFS